MFGRVTYSRRRLRRERSLFTSFTFCIVTGSCLSVMINLRYWYSNGRFVSGCQMVRYSDGGLKTGLKKAMQWSKMSSIQMVRQVM